MINMHAKLILSIGEDSYNITIVYIGRRLGMFPYSPLIHQMLGIIVNQKFVSKLVKPWPREQLNELYM